MAGFDFLQQTFYNLRPMGVSFLTNSILSPIHELQSKGDSSKSFDTHCQFTMAIAPKTNILKAVCGYCLTFSKFLIDFAAFVCELERRDGARGEDLCLVPSLTAHHYLTLLANLTSLCLQILPRLVRPSALLIVLF